jgi:hypothetical protein
MRASSRLDGASVPLTATSIAVQWFVCVRAPLSRLRAVPSTPRTALSLCAPKNVRQKQKCYLQIAARVVCETGYWKGVPFLFFINFPSDKPNDYPMVPPK